MKVMDKMDSKIDLRIAFFSGTMKPGQDGVTRVLYKLLDYLNQNSIPNIAISPVIPQKDDQPSEMFKVCSVSVPLYRDYRMSIPTDYFLKKMIKQFNPTLFHIHSPCSLGFAAVKFAKRKSIPVVATYHTHFPSYARYYKIRSLELCGWNYLRGLYNSCDRVYIPSQPILSELENHQFRNLEHLPHGVEIEIFNPKYRSLEWRNKNNPSNKKILLYAGRLVWEKDLKDLIDAYRILEAERNDFILMFVGDGPIRHELEEMLPNAIFLGYKCGKELSTVFASSDVFVFPSTTETFGNVTLEAMASGLVPICADKGGAAGIIKNFQTGLLFKPNAPVDFAEKIRFVLNNSELRKEISNNAFRYAHSQTWEKIFEKLILSYYKVMEDSKLKKLLVKTAA